MPIDDDVYARSIVHLMKLIVDLQSTVTAIGLVLKARDPDTEAEVGAQRAALLERAAPILRAFERADAAELLTMLQRFSSGRLQ